MRITEFRKIRRDGRVIEEYMTAGDIISLGWPPEQVVEIQWLDCERPVKRQSSCGLLATVVRGRDYVALIENDSVFRTTSSLLIVNSDGTTRCPISDIQNIHGREVRGTFRWFEPPRQLRNNLFGVVFGSDQDSLAFQLDIDASECNIVGASPVK
jgi:hypothetical protein